MNQSVHSVADGTGLALLAREIRPAVCPWCGGLDGETSEIVPKLLVVVDEHGHVLVLGELADEWCCTWCGHEW